MSYDFMDVGCSKGGSLAWAGSIFGGKGFGIDLSPRKVKATIEAGHQAIVADATNLCIPDNSIKFVTMLDMLEHLPGYDPAEKCIFEAYRVISDFILIKGPNFDHEDYIRSLGFKRYFADWHGHTWHHKINDFENIIRKIKPHNALIINQEKIRNSGNLDILPISAAPDQARYDPERHDVKSFVPFARNLYSRVFVLIVKNKNLNLGDIAVRAAFDRFRYFSFE